MFLTRSILAALLLLFLSPVGCGDDAEPDESPSQTDDNDNDSGDGDSDAADYDDVQLKSLSPAQADAFCDDLLEAGTQDDVVGGLVRLNCYIEEIFTDQSCDQETFDQCVANGGTGPSEQEIAEAKQECLDGLQNDVQDSCELTAGEYRTCDNEFLDLVATADGKSCSELDEIANETSTDGSLPDCVPEECSFGDDDDDELF